MSRWPQITVASAAPIDYGLNLMLFANTYSVQKNKKAHDFDFDS
jgi:hypothetical protein